MFLKDINASLYPILPPLMDQNAGPINLLPKDVLSEIFSHTSRDAIAQGGLVNKLCYQAAKDYDEMKFIYHTAVFGNEQWALCGGKDYVKNENMEEEFQSLKTFIATILKSPLFVGKKITDVIDEGYIVRIPKDMDFKKIGHLLKAYFPNNPLIPDSHGYNYFGFPNEQNKPMDESVWVWVPKNGTVTTFKSYDEQEKIIKNEHLEVSRTLEAVACFFAEYCRSGEFLWGSDVNSYRCLEKSYGSNFNVSICKNGIGVAQSGNNAGSKYDIARIWREPKETQVHSNVVPV